MSKRVFKQEFEASFEALGNLVYDAYNRAFNLRDDIVDLGGDVLVGMDFNVNPMSLVIGSRAGSQLHCWDALEIETSNTLEVATYLRERFGDRPITVCPDPSGKARKTSASGETDFSILREHSINIDASHAAIPVRDRINTVNALLENASGERNLFLHPRCTKTLGRSLMGLTYKDDTNIPNPKGGLVHITDALGYLVYQQFNTLLPQWRSVQIRY